MIHVSKGQFSKVLSSQHLQIVQNTEGLSFIKKKKRQTQFYKDISLDTSTAGQQQTSSAPFQDQEVLQNNYLVQTSLAGKETHGAAQESITQALPSGWLNGIHLLQHLTPGNDNLCYGTAHQSCRRNSLPPPPAASPHLCKERGFGGTLLRSQLYRYQLHCFSLASHPSFLYPHLLLSLG